ncbi:PTS sugar transporter subunit IIA [Anaerotalea alkaliphila]|uniref:PTS transporter subunit EIIA n=1 Tax=Anaerotalea alkaliphila TaxID=2662126 RepID=A0A7X5HVE3_9FIRM|nr:fructose PTS transporter subunit IIA [Anaerotalea alkaliphila]NDL67358.1 PTS transporter subunit EIIA [Anaerotalea alkaliphila]
MTLINENLVVLGLEASSKEDVLTKMASIAAQQGKVNDVQGYTTAVLHRESEYSTAVGFGVAIPHGKTDAVTEPFLMFASVEPIDWAALDGGLVDLVFLIGVPEKEAGSTHLKILAALSRKLMKSDFRDGLRAVKTPQDLLQLLKESDIGL